MTSLAEAAKGIDEAIKNLRVAADSAAADIQKCFTDIKMPNFKINHGLPTAGAPKLAYLHSEARRRGFVSPKLAKRMHKHKVTT